MPNLTIKCTPPNSKPILHTTSAHDSLGQFIKSLVDIPYAHLSSQILTYEDLSNINIYRGHMCDVVLYRAALRSTNMSNCWLIGANLQHVDARFAKFSKSRMFQADLRHANLQWANFPDADLRSADLRGANLCGANLYEADLRDADLREADLRGANLRGANLRGANLCGANLYEADLREADLRGANLRGANLRGAVVDAKPQGVPKRICAPPAPYNGETDRPASPITQQDIRDALAPKCPIPAIANHAHGSFYRITGPTRKRVPLSYVLARVAATNATEDHPHVIVNRIIDWIDYTLPHATLTFIAHK